MKFSAMRLNTIAKYSRSALCAGFVLLFLGACATPTQQSSTPRATVKDANVEDERPDSELSRIAMKYNNLPASQNPQRNAELLSLADTELSANNCARAQIILKFIEPSLVDAANKSKSDLLKIECVLESITGSRGANATKGPAGSADAKLTTVTSATNGLAELKYASTIDLLDTWQAQSEARLLSPTHAARLTVARAQIAALQDKYELAIRQLLSLVVSNSDNGSKRSLSVQQKHDFLWRWYSGLNAQQKMSLSSRYPIINDISTLFGMIQDSSINDNVRQASIRQWLLQNPMAEISVELPQQLKLYLALERNKQDQIAVLLPLSGRLSSQGDAIKQGILSAYLQEVSASSSSMSQQASQLIFIDTGSNTELPTSVNADLLSSFDMIIGPLLKSHVTRVNSFRLPQRKQVVLNQAEPHSAVNSAANSAVNNAAKSAANSSAHAALSSHDAPVDSALDSANDESISLTAYFALSPEQEAEQLVLLMRKRNIASPILIRDDSAVSDRMAKAFTQAWENTLPKTKAGEKSKSGSTKLQEITFTSNKSMRVGITSALDVLQSQQRIKQLENLSQERVYSVTRNRRDIDAFVVFSRPDELELINPIIESSISLFTNEQLPVFASSYSYDHKQSKNSRRDLRNLVFVDMPWLIENSSEDRRTDTLSQQVDELFNEPSSAFLRLFAFGYDALAVADNLAQLSIFEHMQINGLSGKLSLDNSSVLNRELAWLAITDANN